MLWVLGFESESDFCDLQKDIQCADKVAKAADADAARKKALRSISTTLVEVVHV